MNQTCCMALHLTFQGQLLKSRRREKGIKSEGGTTPKSDFEDDYEDVERRKRDKREAREDGAGNLATRFKRMVQARRVRVMSKGFLNDGDELEDRVANNRCFLSD